MSTFGERIKKLRKQKGLTQRQMAETFGITERNYQRYEASDSPSNDTLLKLADFFGVTTDYLLGRNDSDYKPRIYGKDGEDSPIGAHDILNLDTDELRRRLDESSKNDHRLQIVFDEPLQSYAVWLRQMGIAISGSEAKGTVVVGLEDETWFDVTDGIDGIIRMSKEHFSLLARQLGKSWPLEEI